MFDFEREYQVQLPPAYKAAVGKHATVELAGETWNIVAPMGTTCHNVALRRKSL